MKVTAISFLLCILLISNVYAIRINEVEVNPVGGSAGKEWIELYNNGTEIDISGWMVYDGLISPSKIFTIPNNTLLQSDLYYIIELNYSKLNNGGDFVTLYDSLMHQVDQTSNLNDSYADIRAWQFCEGGWEFLNSTRGQENNCIVDEEIIPLENNESQENSSSETSSLEDNVSESQEEDLPQTQEEITSDFIPASIDEEKTQNSYNSDSPEKIFLSPKKNSEEIFVSSEGKLRNYVPYLFMVLVIVLCIYLAFKKL